MPFQRIPNTAEVHIRGTLLGQDTENLLYYQYEGALTETMLKTLVDNVSAVVIADWLDNLSLQWLGREVYGRDLNTELALQYTNDDISSSGGTVAGDCLPSYATIAIARRSGRTGRTGRGRIFWQGIPEAWSNGQSMSGTQANALIACLEAADQAAVTAGFEPAIISRSGTGTTPTLGTVYPLQTWTVTDPVLDTRRSRKPKASS